MVTTATVTLYSLNISTELSSTPFFITVGGKKLKDNTPMDVRINFTRSGLAIPAAFLGPTPFFATIYMTESSSLPMVDMLRNEKPLQMVVNGTYFRLLTSVGEGVGAHEIGA